MYHPAIEKMTQVVNYGEKLLKNWIGDLIHDGYQLADLKPEAKFYWCLKEDGTHFATEESVVKIWQECFSGTKVELYHWDGENLNQVTYEDVLDEDDECEYGKSSEVG